MLLPQEPQNNFQGSSSSLILKEGESISSSYIGAASGLKAIFMPKLSKGHLYTDDLKTGPAQRAVGLMRGIPMAPSPSLQGPTVTIESWWQEGHLWCFV